MYTAAHSHALPPKKTAKPSKNTDPFADREARKYANPIVSREHILRQLEAIGEPVSFQEFAYALKMADEDQLEALRRRLNAMARDGQIIKNRKGAFGLTTHMDLLPGKVQGNKDGSGYFIPDSESEDLYLPPREMARLFDGDRVLVRAAGADYRGRSEATVVEILQRKHEEIVGRYYQDAGFGFVAPDSKRIQHEILVAPDKAKGACDGQYVIARIVEFPNKRRKAVGEVVEILGDVATPGIEIDLALHSFSIPHQWPAALQKEVKRFPADVSGENLALRHDLRKVPLVTIDGEDAKDFDDAVFATANSKGGWNLIVAIADVSHYVLPGTRLDEEAELRGTSVYFPGHVVPMLPEALSNGLCSLKPNVDRLAMVCEMEVLPTGEVKQFQFFEAVIHSHARLTYSEVADMLQSAESEHQKQLHKKLRGKQSSQVLGNLDALKAVYAARLNWRKQRGAMDFDTPETRIVFGEDKKIREIVLVNRNDAHRLIEECMLCANVAAAQLFEHQNCRPCIVSIRGQIRIALEGLREFLMGMGLILGGGDEPTPENYQQVLLQIADRPDRHMLQTMLIRSMMQAVYQPANIGHFGLGFSAYTHFTSPIRRYPDLLVHRGIRYLIRNKQGKHIKPHSDQDGLRKEDIYPYNPAQLDQLGESCSDAERRADAASYSVIDWLKCEYMSDRVGEEFPGTITAVTSFGLFVELDGIFVEGLVHITDLSNDYYHFDPVHHRLDGERNGKSYSLGDPVEVSVARVDLEEKKIDLHLLGIDQSRSFKSRRRSAPKTSSRPGKSAGRGRNTNSKKAEQGKAGSGKDKSGSAKRKLKDSKQKAASKKNSNKKHTNRKTSKKKSKASVSKQSQSQRGNAQGKSQRNQQEFEKQAQEQGEMSSHSNWITGIHAVNQLIERRPEAIERLLVVDERENKRVRQLLTSAQSASVPIEKVSRNRLEEICPQAHQGVAVLVSQESTELSEKELMALLGRLSHPALLLVLDGVTDPHNLGACLRTADAAGVDAVIVPKDKSASLNMTVRKVASGAAETVRLVTVTNLARCLATLQQAGIWLVGTDDQADADIYSQDLTGSIALIMGSEGKGLRRLTRETCDFLVSIPMAGDLSSLNVSVASGVALFEAVRQRRQPTEAPSINGPIPGKPWAADPP